MGEIVLQTGFRCEVEVLRRSGAWGGDRSLEGVREPGPDNISELLDAGARS